jgi:hypothetical protein
MIAGIIVVFLLLLLGVGIWQTMADISVDRWCHFPVVDVLHNTSERAILNFATLVIGRVDRRVYLANSSAI